MNISRHVAVLVAAIAPALVVILAAPASAQIRRRPSNTGGVTIPYNTSDAQGNQWSLYQNAMLQQRGNVPVISQGAMLLVNGEMVQQNNANGVGRAAKDDKTGEIIFDGFSSAGLAITRRVLFRNDAGYVRYIDLFKNIQPQPVSIDVQLQTRVNYGVNNSQTVPDPANNDHVLGWVAQTQANRAVVIITAGRASRHPMTLSPQQDQNLAQSDLQLTVPANKEVAVMSVYSTAAAIDGGMQFVTGLKDGDLLKDCPPEIRREIINFNTSDLLIGDREVLRGTSSDVIELRGDNAGANGTPDQLRGTLKDSSYTLHTFYGDITLPADRIIGMISMGQFRAHQLLITSDGQVFGGELTKSTVPIELSSGQVTEVPLSQISRFGYRMRPNETDADAPPKARPLLLLRSGDRIAITVPQGTIEFLSRYGALKMPPTSVSAIAFQTDDSSVHTLYLTDGSHLSGLLQSTELTVTLDNSSPGSTTQPSPSPMPAQTITIPVAAIAKLQLFAPPADLDDQTPTLVLANGDLMVGTVSGDLKVDTAFDSLTVKGSEIRTLTHARDAGNDVQIGMWDQTRLSGSLSVVQIPIKLLSGPDIAAPVALIDAYNQPQPQASTSMIQQIDATVKDLAADDWKQRERAETALVAMGPAVIGHLKEISASQPPEAQERIAAVIRKLTEKKTGAGNSPPGGE